MLLVGERSKLGFVSREGAKGLGGCRDPREPGANYGPSGAPVSCQMPFGGAEWACHPILPISEQSIRTPLLRSAEGSAVLTC